MKFKMGLLFFSIFLMNCTNPTTTLYVGTYTNGDGEGIYKFLFNTKTGALSNKQLVAASENPSYLTYSPDKKYVYAVNENENGMISSFKVQSDGQLSFLNQVSTNGAHPCHVAINNSGNKIIVSNYTGGNASIYSVKKNRVLAEAFQVLDHNTDSISSHVHSAQFYQDLLYVSDLGKNAVYNYKLENKKYKLVDSSIIKLTNKAGPRHFTLSNDGQFIYVINEYANSISSAKKVKNKFELIDHVSTLSKDYNNYNACADIKLSKNERFLYDSNRGENSIVVFKRNIETGTIEKIQNINVEGDWPRNFTLDPTGDFLLVANQKSSNISVFKINKVSGTLSFINSVEMDSPVCLLF